MVVYRAKPGVYTICLIFFKNMGELDAYSKKMEQNDYPDLGESD